ncbi:helix-turn-helix domain-containing protein [Aureitalea marina]|uniref:Helix-turn-helix domain-containing protein n=1 Tax=Aureitalea marina TaxID=930804 RepID=A0A2S7KNB0_9FLAO|nr:helix-turn-helix domain-containing protein [Aureitalea marina]PQB04116.1 hypothetical protein BST85_03770 [Aureitalea marina]
MYSNPFDQIDHRLKSIEEVLTELNKKTSENRPVNYTVKETAEILKVSEQSIRSYINRGLLPAARIGRHYVIDKEVIDNLDSVKSLRYQRTK